LFKNYSKHETFKNPKLIQPTKYFDYTGVCMIVDGDAFLF